MARTKRESLGYGCAMSDWIGTKKAMEMLGVGSTTIKRWANENRLPHIRTAGGHRRFRRSDVERILRQPSRTVANNVSIDEWTGRLVANTSVAVIRDELTKLRGRLGSWFAVADFLGSVLQHIETGWPAGDHATLDEQLAAGRLNLALAVVSSSFRIADEAPICLAASPPGEQQVLGLSLVRTCLRSEGIDVLWVGVHARAHELVSHARTWNRRCIGLSASRSPEDRASLARAYRAIAAACEEQSIELVLGDEGAPPAQPSHGHRCHSFQDLHRILQRLNLPVTPA